MADKDLAIKEDTKEGLHLVVNNAPRYVNRLVDGTPITAEEDVWLLGCYKRINKEEHRYEDNRPI